MVIYTQVTQRCQTPLCPRSHQEVISYPSISILVQVCLEKQNNHLASVPLVTHVSHNHIAELGSVCEFLSGMKRDIRTANHYRYYL